MSLGNENIHQRGEIPEIIKLPNNRIRVIRRFQKFTREDVDNVNLGSLMGNFGDLDATDEQITNQGYSNCRLISVEVDTRFNQQANADNAVLVKTYETLTGEFVEISSDTQEVGESNLKKITKVYRAISGTTSSNTVGTTPLNPVDPEDDNAVSDGIILASSKIEDNTGLAELTEEYIESGVLSVSESHRYGDKVEVYSVEGINITEEEAKAAVTNLPEDAKLYGIKVSNFLGLETNVFEFFTGSGVISTQISYSYNNKLTRTTIVSIDVVPEAPSGAVLIESKSETRDEFILYTYTFVSGEGVVSTETSNKYGTTLDVVTITSINVAPAVPSGAYTKESNVREESGYLLYSTTYVSGSGEIGRSTDTRYDGKLTLTTVTSINEAPDEDGALIEFSVQEGDYGTVYTYTFAEGSGEIGRSTDSKYNGKLTLITVTSLDEAPDEDGALIKSSVQDNDYGQIYTYTFASGSGEIGRTTDTKYDGKLTLTTVTSLDEVPDEDGALISSSIRDNDYGQIYTYTFASGQGEIGRSIDGKYNNKLILTTVTSLDEAPDEDGALIKSSTQDTDYGTVYTYTFASGSGEIGRSTDSKYDDKLTLTTVTSLETAPDEDGSLVRSDTRQTDYGVIYTYTFANGEGEIGRTTENKYDGKLILTTVTSLNEVPDEDGYLFKSDSTSNDYGIIYSYVFAQGEGLIGSVETKKYQNKLTIKSETYLNDPNPTVSVGFTLINTESRDGDFGTITTLTSASGSGQISSNIESRNDGSIVKTFVFLGLESKPSIGTDFYLLEESVQASDGYDMYTYYYYKPPVGYTTSISTNWNNPSRLGWDREQGFFISQVGSMDPITGTATVTFTADGEAPSAIALSDLSVSAVTREAVKYRDGTKLVRSTTFTNTYYNSADGAVNNGDYLGEAVASGAVSSAGQELPHGTVTLAWETVPYFYAGGTTIWKTTHTTATL